MTCYARDRSWTKKQTREFLAYLREHYRYMKTTGEFHRLKQHQKWLPTRNVGYPHPSGYWLISIRGKSYTRSRLAWLFVMGRWPLEEIDHKNNRSRDDRWCNLRPASRTQNNQNSVRRKNKAGAKGVYKAKSGRYRAIITCDKKRHELGYFETLAAAEQAAKRAAKRLHEKFAR